MYLFLIQQQVSSLGDEVGKNIISLVSSIIIGALWVIPVIYLVPSILPFKLDPKYSQLYLIISFGFLLITNSLSTSYT